MIIFQPNMYILCSRTSEVYHGSICGTNISFDCFSPLNPGRYSCVFKWRCVCAYQESTCGRTPSTRVRWTNYCSRVLLLTGPPFKCQFLERLRELFLVLTHRRYSRFSGDWCLEARRNWILRSPSSQKAVPTVKMAELEFQVCVGAAQAPGVSVETDWLAHLRVSCSRRRAGFNLMCKSQ